MSDRPLSEFDPAGEWAEAPTLILIERPGSIEVWKRWCVKPPEDKRATPYRLVETRKLP